MIRRWLLWVGLGLLLLLGGGFGVKPAPVLAQADPAAEMFRLINEFRATKGLPAFQYNASLAIAAQNHANWMATNVIYSHTGAGGSTPLSRAQAAGYNGYVSENIVGGTNQSPRQGLIWWQNSNIHYNTLVSTRYYEAGVGFATNGEQNMYVLVVGRPSNAPANGESNSGAGALAKPLIVTPIELAEPREDGSIVHVLRMGQALWTVAAYYDVELDYLYLINGLTESDILQPGFEVMVRLADGQEPPPTPTPPLTHIVRQGESAWSIASQHGIGLDFLYLLNNMGEDAVLRPGDEIVVRLAPGQSPPPTPTPRTTHIVRSGESLWLIAARYGLTVPQLMELNAMNADSVIQPGDELRVRQPVATPTPTATPTMPPATPTPTPVEQATAVQVIAGPVAGPSPSPPAAASTARLPAPAGSEGDGAVGAAGVLAAIVGLLIVTGIVVIVARRQEST